MKSTMNIYRLKFNVSCLIIALISLSLKAQAPTIEWENALGGSGYDDAIDMDLTSDGGYVVVGFSNSNNGDVTGNHGGNDVWVVKLNSNGSIQWQNSYGGTNDDFGQSVKQTSDGGYIVAGYTWSTDGDVSGNNGQVDFWVVKLDSAGNLQWQNALGGTNHDYAKSVKQSLDGGYIVVGHTFSNNGDVTGNHGNFDYWVVKLDTAGNLTWQKTYGGTFGDEGEDIELTTDGGYIIAGHSFSSDGDVLSGNQGLRDFWIVKIDSSGNIEWENSMGGSATEYAQSIKQTTDGGYIVCGDTFSNNGDVSGNHGSDDFWVVKIDGSGQIEWQNALGGSSTENANSIQQTPDGGYIVAGYASSTDGDVSGGNGSMDFWLVRLDNLGSLIWQKTFGGSSGDEAESIAITADGGFIAAGAALSGDGDVTGNHGNYDFWVVKTTPEVLSVLDPDENEFVIYPNPVNDVLHFVSTEQIDRIRIYNSLGQPLLDEYYEEDLTSFDFSAFSSGMYIVTVTTNARTNSYKIIKR